MPDKKYNCGNCPYMEKKQHNQIVGQEAMFCYWGPPALMNIQGPAPRIAGVPQQTAVQLRPQPVPVGPEIWCYQHPRLKAEMELYLANEEDEDYNPEPLPGVSKHETKVQPNTGTDCGSDS